MVEAGAAAQISPEEQQRIMSLLAPLKEDKAAWESSFTDEEKQKGAAFEDELKKNPEALQTFVGQIDSTFTEADSNGDGKLVRDEFKQFVSKMNAHGVARGLKHRETTDEFIDKVFPSFDGFNPTQAGVSKAEIMIILNLINQE